MKPSSETFHRFYKCVNCWTFPCFEPKTKKMVHIFSSFFIRRYFSNNIRCVTILAYLNLRNQPAVKWNCWVLQVRWLCFFYHEADKYIGILWNHRQAEIHETKRNRWYSWHSDENKIQTLLHCSENNKLYILILPHGLKAKENDKLTNNITFKTKSERVKETFEMRKPISPVHFMQLFKNDWPGKHKHEGYKPNWEK